MEERENVGICVNTVPDKQSIESVGNVILQILASEQDQMTVQKALDVFGGCMKANPVTIQGCTVSMGEGEQ